MTTALEFVRRFARARPAPREECELCSVELAADHAHLVESAARRLVCVCQACSVLVGGQAGAKYRRVPRRAEELTDFRLGEVAWAGLGLPVNLAFFLHSTSAGRVVVVYPSPGGATEAPVDADAWDELLNENPRLRDLEPDVEALLIHRVGAARDHFRVGIDQCYKLVGLVRTHWSGFTGGAELWEEIAAFFNALRDRR